MPFPPSIRKASSKGVALVIILCFIVLLLGVTMAFFSRSMARRQNSNSSASQTNADIFARSSLNIVIGDLIQEIKDGSNPLTTGTVTIYQPQANTNVIPAVAGVNSSATPNLIKRSASGVPFYTLTTPAVTGTSRAVAVSSTVPSINGRSVGMARWNAPLLTPAGTAWTPPDWILVARDGSNPIAWNANMKSGTSASTVVGRFAYAIYDESGLLDINAAGFPSTAASSTVSGLKGGTVYADLTQLGLSTAQIDQIVGWRNYASAQPGGTFPNFTFDAAGAQRFQTQMASNSNTFLTITGTTPFNGNTDQAMLSRQQLIKFIQGIATTTPTQAQTVLQCLGNFSREVNGPTWAPTVDYTAPYNYKTSGTLTSGTIWNPFVMMPRVSGTFTRWDGSTAMVGEPLVKNRFPLGKLALLTGTNPVGDLSAQDKDDIARYFGLDLVTSGSYPSNGYARHWRYPTGNTAYKHSVLSGVTGVMSLNDVAAQNREPDFFELLQAGMLAGSLGRGRARADIYASGTVYSSWGLPEGQSGKYSDADSKATYQILQIGANIIDQTGSDNYPSTITFAPNGASVDDGYSFYGSKDLPYLNNFLCKMSGTYTTTVSGTAVSGTLPVAPYSYSLWFELWNPHQASSTGGACPTDFKISPHVNDTFMTSYVMRGGTGTVSGSTWQFNDRFYFSGTTAYSGSNLNAYNNYPNHGEITFTIASGSSATAYREPAPVSGTNITISMASLPSATGTSDHGRTWPEAYNDCANDGRVCSFELVLSTLYRIQFKDPNGVYRTYATFTGADTSQATNSAFPTNYHLDVFISWYQFTGPTPYPVAGAYPKSDPRTSRFGFGSSTPAGVSSVLYGSLMPAWLSTSGTYPKFPLENAPFQQSSSYASPSAATCFRMDLLALNTNNGGAFSPPNYFYSDNDGQVRQGDALNCCFLSSSVNSFNPLFSGTGASATYGLRPRPVILNRPFRSVGELGYVYRDMPWKTLDFSSPLSADAALLDLFTITSGTQPLLAGRVSPNTRHPEVLKALISGATLATSSTVSAANANTVAQAMVTMSGAAPFTNRADLVTQLMNDATINASISRIKTEREAVIRALADGANTRTWNLLIDLVAQVGKYPASATGLNNFLVEGERHYWLHVAIDRYTGQVVDKQLEMVRE